jgi:hypothetical protein
MKDEGDESLRLSLFGCSAVENNKHFGMQQSTFAARTSLIVLSWALKRYGLSNCLINRGVRVDKWEASK